MGREVSGVLNFFSLYNKQIMIDFKKALFIRLGEKGSWAQECIDKGVIRLSFKNPYHQECLNGNWDLLKNH